MTKFNASIQQLRDAAKLLHWRHGAGDIKNIQVFMDGTVVVTAQRTSHQAHTRKGRIHGNTVKLYGHQLTVRPTSAYAPAIACKNSNNLMVL